MRPQPLEYATPVRETKNPAPRRRFLTARQERVRWGFTWAAVLAMFGLPVLAVLGPRYSSYDPLAARRAAAYTDMANLDTALEEYHADTGQFPTAAEGLNALVTAPAGVGGWEGPYLSSLKKDPWGRPYLYRTGAAAGNRPYRLLSAGQDGNPGTEDDVKGEGE